MHSFDWEQLFLKGMTLALSKVTMIIGIKISCTTIPGIAVSKAPLINIMALTFESPTKTQVTTAHTMRPAAIEINNAI